MVKARGLKKKDLAQAMGISPQAVSTRLQGTANWTLDEACAAADFLRVPLDTLLRASLTAGEVLEGDAGPSLIVRGKGDKQRIVPISEDLAKRITAAPG